jgi:hypothetical protein
MWLTSYAPFRIFVAGRAGGKETLSLKGTGKRIHNPKVRSPDQSDDSSARKNKREPIDSCLS